MAKPFHIEATDLGGGKLRDIVGAVMVPPKPWAKHVARLKPEGRKTCAALAKALGHAIPSEVAEWLDLEGPRGLPEPIDAGWYLALDVAVPAAGRAGAIKALAEQSLLLLTGMVPFGRDASGDQVFASLRPHPLEVAGVYLFDHETGKLDDQVAASLAQFVVEKWVDDDESPARAACAAFEKRANKQAKPESHALWQRAHWLFGLLGGEPAFRFPELLAAAPSFATWTKEKARLPNEPQLAVYWILAHLYLGNEAAAREAAALAATSSGTVIAELGDAFATYLDGKGKLPLASAAAFAACREVVAKNALPEQLAPGKAGAKRADGAAEHDAALAALAKGDKRREAFVERYRSERSDEVYNHWAYKPGELVPDWAVSAVAGTWRSGVSYDLGHPRAYAGVTRAVCARADHADARAALIEALGTLAANDDRLEHVVPALLTRDEPEVREAVRAAAWRWIDVAGKIDKVLAKREQTNTLDDMVAKDDLIQPCVHAVLKRCDDEAEKLAVAIAEAKPSFRVLKAIAGYVYRVYGARGMKDRTERLAKFLELLDQAAAEPEADQLRLDLTASVAFAEASLALARLDPAAARARFRAVLALKRERPDRAALASCVLPGVLALDPADRDGLAWLERLLAIRTPQTWLYGAYIAAVTAPALRWHAYLSEINDMMEDFKFLEATVRERLVELGAPAPAYDDTDEFAEKVPTAALGEALHQYDRYKASAVLDRIEEKKAKATDGLVRYLTDQLAASGWTPESHFTSDEIQQALRLVGKTERTQLARLPDLAPYAKEWISDAD